MSTELTAEVSFQEKIKARIRESIGDLMPDEMLQQLVGRATEEAFFKTREAPPSYYGGRAEVREAWLTEFVRAELQKRVEIAVNSWMAANADKVSATIQQTLDGGILTCVSRAVSRQFDSPLRDLECQLNLVVDKLRGIAPGNY